MLYQLEVCHLSANDQRIHGIIACMHSCILYQMPLQGTRAEIGHQYASMRLIQILQKNANERLKCSFCGFLVLFFYFFYSFIDL